MSLRRSIIAIAPFIGLLVFVACADQENPKGVTIPPDTVQPDGGKPTTDETENPDGTATKHLCKVQKKGSDASKVITGTLLLPAGPKAGELFIDANGVIACADASCAKTAGYDKATKIECTSVAISPGLINPHDHIAFANNPPSPEVPERYEHRHDWRKGKAAQPPQDHTVIKTNAPQVKNAVAAAELRFLMSGTTSTASAGAAGSGAPGLMRNIDSNAKQLEGLPITLVVSDTFPLKDTDGILSTTCDGYPPARVKTADVLAKHSYIPHMAEGINDFAHAEFLCQSNTFPSVPDADHDLIQRQTAVVHGVAVNPGDIQQFQKDEAILVWSPRSNVSLYGNTAPIAEYAHLGVSIALGTDWLPSGSMNFARELKCADDLNKNYFGGALTDKQLWESVTINAALATGTANTIGKLRAGWIADIAIFDASKSKDYRAVIEAGVEDTILVLRGGKVMYGDSELLGEMGENDCEDLPVCKVTKKVCANKDEAAAVKLADLQAAATSVYPLFFCKDQTPKNEPTCTPKRGKTATDDAASSYSGVASGDKDGDGVKDADDNCPTVFNPIRPMDHGAQGDVDGDGIGDACDKCPLDDGEDCTPPDANDIDGDGVPNAVDNCPKDKNEDQKDADNDGKGAVCDLCDDLANPGDSLCPVDLTISDIRDPSSPKHPAPNSSHPTIKGVVVTAVKTGMSGLGFYVQDPTATKFGGLFVFTSTAPSPAVAIGNVVDIEGDYTEFKGQSEITKPKITIVDPKTTLDIVPIAVTDQYNTGAQGEEIEGMLCTIDSELTVTQSNADTPPADFDEFIVKSASGLTNIWIDDFVFDALGNDYPVDKKFKKVVGICSVLDTQRKIFPRSFDDIPEVP